MWYSPGWCGSVDWVPACEPKGHWFDSQSGHMPGLWARSPVGGAREATTHWCFSLSLSLSLPLSLKINKSFKTLKNKMWNIYMNISLIKGKLVICNNMDEPGGYHAKWNKPDTERQIPHDFTSYVGPKNIILLEAQSRMMVLSKWKVRKMLLKGYKVWHEGWISSSDLMYNTKWWWLELTVLCWRPQIL